MYLEFFGLKESPFTLVSDPRFLYYSESHCDAMSTLLYGVRERKGIMLMLGEAGTGKTTLVRATLDLLRSTRVVTSVVMNPILSHTEEFFDAILRGFGLEGYQKTNVEMADVLQRFLVRTCNAGKIPVLVVDEAQELSKPLLEQLRMLSNLEFHGQKMLQFVLAAQPEMNQRLESFEMRALRQRIVVRCRLQPLTPLDTWNYVQTRLVCAGSDGHEIFAPEAVERLYGYTGGVPRIINSIADNCLLAAYARGMEVVDAALVDKVAVHLDLSLLPSASDERESIHLDIVRASSSWREVAHDLRASTGVPTALRQFVEKLQSPNDLETTSRVFTTATQRGK
jgi:general secretion pathway protein A